MGLTNNDESFCQSVGIAGILFTAITLIQHLISLPFEWVSLLLMLPYFFSVMSFIALIKKSQYAPILIVISAGLLFMYLIFTFYLYLTSSVLIFSVGNFLFFFFLVVLIVIIYVNELPKRLKYSSLKLRDEKIYWQQRI